MSIIENNYPSSPEHDFYSQGGVEEEESSLGPIRHSRGRFSQRDSSGEFRARIFNRYLKQGTKVKYAQKKGITLSVATRESVEIIMNDGKRVFTHFSQLKPQIVVGGTYLVHQEKWHFLATITKIQKGWIHGTWLEGPQTEFVFRMPEENAMLKILPAPKVEILTEIQHERVEDHNGGGVSTGYFIHRPLLLD